MQLLIDWFKILISELPIEWFVFIVSFLDEIFPPIPSPLVMMVAAARLTAENSNWLGYIWLVGISTIGKTIASLFLYWLGNKGEKVVVQKYGKWLRVSHEQIERISVHINRGWKDDVLLFISRMLPILPTTVVSLACGVFKTDRQHFFWLTLVGMFLRNLLLLGLVLYGAQELQELTTMLRSEGLIK
jgi:membrane protein DedA with SNARE-associated domain